MGGTGMTLFIVAPLVAELTLLRVFAFPSSRMAVFVRSAHSGWIALHNGLLRTL